MGGTRFRALRARGAREAKSAYHMFMWGPRQFQRDITHPRTPTYDQKTPAVLLPSYIKSNSKISLSFTNVRSGYKKVKENENSDWRGNILMKEAVDSQAENFPR